MRNIKFVAATLLLAGSAHAADMPIKAPPAPAPVMTWTGFYVGGNLGWARGDSSWCTTAHTGTTGCGVDVVGQNANSVAGGVQLGGRWQFGSWVIGAEAMFDGMSVGATSPSCLSLASPCGGVEAPGRTRSTTFNNLFSGTGQLGYVWGSALLYGKGGFATTQVSFDANNTTPGGFDVSATTTARGWTAGAGIEYMLNNVLSVGVEYNYYQFNNISDMVDRTNSGGNVISCAFCGISSNVQTVAARVNVKLNPL
jgi:outer membrane immunogenic protein